MQSSRFEYIVKHTIKILNSWNDLSIYPVTVWEHADLMIRCVMTTFASKRLKLANELHWIIVRLFFLAKWLDVSFKGWKQNHKLTALFVLYFFTLTNKHTMIQMGMVCLAWQEQRPYLFGNLCKANTASYHPSSARVMRAWINQWLLCLWAAGLLNYFNATFIFCRITF